MNLAPVADINSNPENIGIGIRSFGDNAELVTDMALSMYRGYVDSGVLPTIKHFPGLGDIAVDSHHDLPILYKTLDELKKQELIPYLKGINNCVESIMVSHILVHELDKEYPASMSKAVITDLLKTELGYNGLIMTDCFEMGAIQKNYGTGEAVVIALNAGIDLFDISHSENLQTEAFEAVYRAVENGTISKERIEESYNKIIAYKKSQVLETSKSEMPDLGTVYKRLLNTNIVENKLDDIENTIALAVNQFSSNPAEDEIVNPVNISSLFESLTNIKTLEYNVNDSIETLTNLATEAKDYKNVIVFVGDIDIYKNQIELLKKLSDKNVYLIDMRLKTTNVPIETKAYIKAYSYTDDTVKLLCEFLKEKLI